MMTKGEFLHRFERQPDGAGAAQNPSRSMDRAARSPSDME